MKSNNLHQVARMADESRIDKTNETKPEKATHHEKPENKNGETEIMKPAEDRTEATEEQNIEIDLNGSNEEIDAARQEAAENYERFLRVTAEFENYKKRFQRQLDENRKFANESLLRELLTVVDNLERAIKAAAIENPSKEVSFMIEGVRMTLKDIMKIFKNYNVTPIDAHGQPFDPAYHEAVMQAESDEHPENTVVNEFQKGYLLHDRLLRPAMVVVSKGSS